MRIAVTGIGAVSAVGVGWRALDEALRTGRSGIGALTLFDAEGHKTRLAAQAPTDLPLNSRQARHCSRSDLLGLIAAREALEEAALTTDLKGPIGLYVGATTGGMLASEPFLGQARSETGLRAPFDALIAHPLSATADRIATSFGFRGPRATVCTACSSGANAIGLALRALRAGRVRLALAGGVDALCRLTFTGFNALGAVDSGPCRPFDRNRNGLTLGEAGAMLVLEPWQDAKARGARIWAELRGHGACSEAHHITNPLASGEGAARALTLALEDSGLGASFIDYVNAHGTATRLNDAMESKALCAVLGERVTQVPVSSSKGQLGHTLGAAGAIEAVVTVLSLSGGYAPPTAGLRDPDPECPLDHVIGVARPHRSRAAISSSFGFGGNNAALVFAAADVADELPVARVESPGRVVVTGLAALSPPDGGQTIEIDLRRALDPARSRRLDRLSKIACVATGAALADASLTSAPADGLAVVLGTGFGSFDESIVFMERVLAMGPRLAPPADFPNLVLSAPAAHAGIYHGLSGTNLTLTGLGASADLAIAAGFDEVASGNSTVCLAGGAEVHSDAIASGLRSRSTGARPSRARRTEGAGVLVLESEKAALARGRRPIARLVACATAGAPLDGHANPLRLAIEAIREALRRAGTTDVRAAVATTDRELAEAALRETIGLVDLEVLSERVGYHEALGALSAVRCARKAQGADGAVLALGFAPGLASCAVFAPP